MPNNILFILVDQWPARSFGHCGAPISTPATDTLASDSTRFTNAFTTCPLCSPARGALLTGRWPHQTGMLDNYGVGYSTQEPLDPGEVTWIDAAVEAGYHVGYYGKWHLGPDGPIERGAHRHLDGFDVIPKPYDPATSTYTYERMAAQYAGQSETLIDGRAPFWGVTDQPVDRTEPMRRAAEACGFIDEVAESGGGQPFFLTASFAPPHFPHHLPREYADRVDPEAVELPVSISDDLANRPAFHGTPWWPCMDTSVLDEDEWRCVIGFSHMHISLVDDAIGRILNTLDAAGLADSTTVVFAADHGDMCGAHNRFDKGPYFYDEVFRIPLIVREPGAAPAVQDGFASLIDVGSTLLSCVGAEPHEGRDLRPLIGTSSRPTDWRQEAFGVYDLYNGISFAIRAIRDERYTYVWNLQTVDELYDTVEDPAQMTNLIGRPEVAGVEQRLRSRLHEWLAETGDDPRPNVDAGTVVVTGRPGP